MAIDRRKFLATGLKAGLCAALPSSLAGAANNGRPRYVSGLGLGEESFAVATLEGLELGAELLREGFRFHDLVPHPDGKSLVAPARRPGSVLVVLDLEALRPARRVAADPGYHFYGHGAFSLDGGFFYASENAYESGQGVITRRAVAEDYRVIDVWPSGGIGPHEILMLGDGRLVVANGGILTHPGSGREKLNLETMDPSLVFLDSDSGAILTQLRLDSALNQLSLRHLAATRDGRVVFAAQDEAISPRNQALVGLATPEGGLSLFDWPQDLAGGLEGYMGSIALDAGERFVLASAPRGDQVLAWSLAGGCYLGSLRLPDVCGLAPGGLVAGDKAGRFLATSGLGHIADIEVTDAGPRLLDQVQSGIMWDNHLTRLV